MKNIASTLLISCIIISGISAQEYVTGLKSNGQIKSYLKENKDFLDKNKKLVYDTLELPFWDDFSSSFLYPSANLWIDYDVYINNTSADNPPSLGIATFDAMNVNGEIYEYGNYEIPFIADSLTSMPINLDYSAGNNIYFSFFYRPQGILEDAPEEEDSLILEFYAPEDDEWTQVWFAEGFDDPGQFEFVILPVNEERFLKKGFQFRFKNYVTLGSSTYPSLAVNCDYWHIDYVYLNKDRNINDNIMPDLALNKPLASLLENYESVPWTHYKSNPSLSLKDNISIQYINNDEYTKLIDSINFRLTDLSGNSPVQKGEGGTKIVQAFQQETFVYNFGSSPFTFPSNNEEFCDFMLNVNLKLQSSDSSQNNSTSYKQKFRDYYAYDDGSAEAGYGIYGSGTKFGMVALRFEPLKTDELNGVYMYFTQAFENASQNYFWLYLWEEGDNGLPGDTIKTFEGLLPEYENDINKFHFYEFDESVTIDGPFYIGWMQTTEDRMNIGFDYNTVNNDKLYYNTSGEWIQSGIEGTVMIRPAFGTIFTGTNEITNIQPVVYPNPVKDNLYIKFNTNNAQTKYTADIFDIRGKLIRSEIYTKDTPLNTLDLQKGVYIIRIVNTDTNEHYHSKFIKQ
jgi:uncharacterized protein YqkB